MSIATYNNLICKIFTPATSELSLTELKALLTELLKDFPVENQVDNNKKAYDVDSQYAKKWFVAYNHLLFLVDMKRQDSKYNTSLILSWTAIIISVLAILSRLAPC
jgi:hypothetical protein